MRIKFEKTSYLNALNENESFKDNNEIFNHVKESLQFQYGDVTFQQFNVKYLAKGWFGRKIIALPTAAWSGIVKVVYHLAKAILIGIPIAFSDKGDYLKVQIFYVARDFQEAYGRLTSLFNDRYGQFHVQESGFQKTCYGCFITNAIFNKRMASKKSAPSNAEEYRMRSFSIEYGIYIDSEAKETSLSNYKEKTVEERQKLVQRFKLNQISSQLPESDMSLDEFVSQADTEILNVLTLKDLIIPFQHSKLKFALLDEEKIKALTLGELQEGMNEDQFFLIKQRLKKLSKNEENGQQKALDDYSDFKNIPLKDLVQFSANDIYTHKENIPNIAFSFFKNDQIQNLKLSEMQADQNTALFFALDETEAKKRLALFNEQDVADAIYKGSLTGNILQFLTDDHLKKLKLSQLNAEKIYALFPWSSDNTVDRKRFENFKADDVQAALQSKLLTTHYQLKLLSDDQLKGIQLSQLPKEIINDMFSYSNDNTADRKQFANFKADDVQAALQAGLLTTYYQLKLLSDDQLKGIQLSQLSKKIINDMFSYSNDNTADRKQFANFKADDVQAALQAGLLTTHYQLKLLSDDQLKGIQLSQLSKKIIHDMFSYSNDNTADRKQFANFKADDVQAALQAGLLTTHYQLKLLSDDQLKGIQLSQLSKKIINDMFSYSNDNTADRKQFANFNADAVQAALQAGLLTTHYQLKLLSDDQLKGIQLSQLPKKVIDSMFSSSSDNTADRKQFANFKADDVQAALQAGLLTTHYQLKLLSDDQLKGIQLSQLPKKVIDSMFSSSSDNTADRKQFANFEGAEVQAALVSNQLDDYHVQLISIEQMKEFDFSILSQKMVNLLFPDYSVDYLREKHSYKGFTFKSVNGKVLENTQGKQYLYSEAQLQKMSKDQKQKNDDLLAQLSMKQRRDLEGRLYQNDPL